MKPHLRQTLVTSAILTAGFATAVAVIAFGGVRGTRDVTVFGSTVMALALVVAIAVRSRSSTNDDAN